MIVTERALDDARRDLAAIPGGASLIDMSEALERNVGNLTDALRYVPGVWAASTAGSDGLFFSSRGSNLDATSWDMNGIKLLQDGLPVTTADGNNHNRIVDPLAARYATVARGANALGYGASTLGGAINFVTPTARENAALDALVNVGSHGQRIARVSLGHAGAGAFDGLLTLEGKRWDGFRAHSEQRRTGLYGNAGWTGDSVTMRFYVTSLDNDQRLPGALTRAEMAEDPSQAERAALEGDYRLDVTTRRLASLARWEIDADRVLEAGLSFEEQRLYHPIVWVAPAGVELFSLLIDSDQRDRGAMLRYGQRVGEHDLLIGLHYGVNDVGGGHFRNLAGRPNGLTESIDNQAATTELFAMDRWAVTQRTTLTLAAQAVAAEREVRTTTVSSVLAQTQQTYRRINPRLGVAHSLGDTTFYGNVSRLFEPPTNYDLEDNASGSPLLPMKGTVVEVGTRGRRAAANGSWHWDVALYRAMIDDAILAVEDPAAPGTSLVTNVERTVHAGFEAVFGAVIGGAAHSLEPLLSFTVNDFRFDGSAAYAGNDLPAAPTHFARGELIYRNAHGFHVGPTIDRVGARWADSANTYRIDSHSLLGLRAGWANERWRAFAELRNLHDRRHVATHGVRAIAPADTRLLSPGEPRSAYFGVQVQLR